MKIGVAFFPVRPKFILPMAQRMDELGYDAVWIGEHLVFPSQTESKYPHDEQMGAPFPGTPLFDPLITLSYIAAQTKTIRLGTSIYLAGLRHPIIAAKLAATLDALCGGRFLFGLGAGWLKEEFDAVGAPWKDRGSRLDEAIGILRRLWTEERVAHEGRFYSFPEIGFEPKPAQGQIPIILGGENPASLRRAARLGDGWMGVSHTPDSAAEAVKTLTELRGDGPPMTFSAGPDYLADLDEVRRFRDAGLNSLVVRAHLLTGADKTLESTLDNLTRFAEDVMYPAAEG